MSGDLIEEETLAGAGRRISGQRMRAASAVEGRRGRRRRLAVGGATVNDCISRHETYIDQRARSRPQTRKFTYAEASCRFSYNGGAEVHMQTRGRIHDG